MVADNTPLTASVSDGGYVFYQCVTRVMLLAALLSNFPFCQLKSVGCWSMRDISHKLFVESVTLYELLA